MVEEMSEKEFRSSIVQSQKSAIVLFYLNGCPYCRGFAPEFEKFSKEVKITAAKVEMSNYHDHDLWDEYHIEAVPTVIVFREGQVCTRVDSSHGTCATREALESELRNKPECFTN